MSNIATCSRPFTPTVVLRQQSSEVSRRLQAFGMVVLLGTEQLDNFCEQLERHLLSAKEHVFSKEG